MDARAPDVDAAERIRRGVERRERVEPALEQGRGQARLGPAEAAARQIQSHVRRLRLQHVQVRAAVHDRHALRWTDAEFEERSRRILVLGKWERVAVCIGGIAVGLAITFFDPGMWDDHNRPRIGDPFLGLMSLRMSLLAVAFALLTLCDFKLARSFFRLGRRDVEIAG